jgi:YgiT-type zinc finger domain-containing protein
MRCVVCRAGETRPGTTTVTLERDGIALVVRGVPAEVCENCGESYVGERETAALLDIGEEAARAGVQIEVREFRAA